MFMGGLVLFLFHLSAVIFIVILYIVFRKANVPYPLSRMLLILLMFSILSTSCLGQNYTQSLIPGIYDGISVSNSVAFFILGDDQWSHEKFERYYDVSLTASLLLMAFYIIALLWESMRNKK